MGGGLHEKKVTRLGFFNVSCLNTGVWRAKKFRESKGWPKCASASVLECAHSFFSVFWERWADKYKMGVTELVRYKLIECCPCVCTRRVIRCYFLEPRDTRKVSALLIFLFPDPFIHPLHFDLFKFILIKKHIFQEIDALCMVSFFRGGVCVPRDKWLPW